MGLWNIQFVNLEDKVLLKSNLSACWGSRGKDRKL
jgi:hypothetical protein